MTLRCYRSSILIFGAISGAYKEIVSSVMYSTAYLRYESLHVSSTARREGERTKPPQYCEGFVVYVVSMLH